MRWYPAPAGCGSPPWQRSAITSQARASGRSGFSAESSGQGQRLIELGAASSLQTEQRQCRRFWIRRQIVIEHVRIAAVPSAIAASAAEEESFALAHAPVELRASIFLRYFLQRHQRLSSGLNPGRVSVAPRPSLMREVGFGLEQMEEGGRAHGRARFGAHDAEQPIHRAADLIVIYAANAGQRHRLRGYPRPALDFTTGTRASVGRLPGAQ